MSSQVRTYREATSVTFWSPRDPAGLLHNFARLPTPLMHGGIAYLTSEHLYQALKFEDAESRQYVADALTPHEAKRRAYSLQQYWEPEARTRQGRIGLMREALRVKATLATFREALLATGTRDIVELSKRDLFWGAAPMGVQDEIRGINALGRLLMELRQQLRETAEADEAGQDELRASLDMIGGRL